MKFGMTEDSVTGALVFIPFLLAILLTGYFRINEQNIKADLIKLAIEKECDLKGIIDKK